MPELLLGCGYARDKRLGPPGSPQGWTDLITLDKYVACEADLICDLDRPDDWRPLRGTMSMEQFISITETAPFGAMFRENLFDEVHAYEVLEHLGSQGDASAFFSCFRNIHRVLRPGGHLCATVPSRYSPWLWGDPSHRRAILPESLVFLSKAHIAANRKAGTAMSDFSALWSLDFKIIRSTDNQRTHEFILQAIK